MDVKRIDPQEFVEFGYLHELNRGFLHPLGLALEVICDENGKAIGFGGVWDYRGDPEGMIFAEDTLDPAKARKVAEERERRRPAREAALGYWQQPLPEESDE
jgi:hypothetical protein